MWIINEYICIEKTTMKSKKENKHTRNWIHKNKDISLIAVFSDSHKYGEDEHYNFKANHYLNIIDI